MFSPAYQCFLPAQPTICSSISLGPCPERLFKDIARPHHVRILLVDPHFIGEREASLEMVSGRLPSLGLLALASVLRKDHDVSILDCQFHSWENATRAITTSGADLIALSATTAWRKKAFSLARLHRSFPRPGNHFRGESRLTG